MSYSKREIAERNGIRQKALSACDADKQAQARAAWDGHGAARLSDKSVTL